MRTLAATCGRVFSGSYDRTVCVWDVEGLVRIGTLAGHTEVHLPSLVALTVSSSASYVSSTANSTRVETLSSSSSCIALPGCSVWIGVCPQAVRALAAGGDLVFSGSDDTCVRVWNALSLECLRVLRGHQDNVRVLAVGNGFLYSGSWDKTVHAWNLQVRPPNPSRACGTPFPVCATKPTR